MISQDLSNWLNSHDNMERGKLSRRASMPTLDRIQNLCKYMGDPQQNVPCIHITGTNGKTSVTRITDQLLRTKGLYTGSFTSPHLSKMNERICLDSEPISDEQLEACLNNVRIVEESVDQIKSDSPSYFEILVAAAFELFNEQAIDVGIIEVGMGGKFDATNVCNSHVSVITNVQLDHTQYLGNTRKEIALEKSGIVKRNNKVVIAETDEEIISIFVNAAKKESALPLVLGEDFELTQNDQAVGGRLLSIRTPYGFYEDIFLPVFGSHQGLNALVGIVAAECFIDAPLGYEIIAEAFANVKSPGRLEILQHGPLVLIDGAHNVAGAQSLAAALDEEFSLLRKIYVLGLTHEKDPIEMINALGIDSDEIVIATAADNDRAMEAPVLAESLKQAGIENVVEIPDTNQALEYAKSIAFDDDHIIVTGSLYLVGEVRDLFI